MNAVLVFTDCGVIRATYAGREYIQLYLRAGDVPDSVINVFDYRLGEPTIEDSPQSVLEAVLNWLGENEPVASVSGAWLLASTGQAPAIEWAWDGEVMGARLWSS